MTNSHLIDDETGARLIDQLSINELPEELRAPLWGWLDSDPQLWKRCALVLLEARELESALTGSSESFSLEPTTDIKKSPNPLAKRPNWRRIGAWGLSLSAAFVLGMLFHRAPLISSDSRPDLANRPPPNSTQSNETGAASAAEQTAGAELPATGNERAAPNVESLQRDVASSRPSKVPTDGVDLLSPYRQSQLNKQGFNFHKKRQMVSVSLPDGRKLQVPVNEVLVGHTGIKVY